MDASRRGWRALVRAASVTGAAAVLGTVLGTSVAQGVNSWMAWRDAAPVRIPVAAVQALWSAHWSVEAPAAVESLPVESAPAVAAVSPRRVIHRRPRILVPAPKPVLESVPAASEVTSANIQALLRNLAFQNSDRIHALWMAEPTVLPAEEAVRSPSVVASAGTVKKPRISTDRLKTSSARPVSTQPGGAPRKHKKDEEKRVEIASVLPPLKLLEPVSKEPARPVVEAPVVPVAPAAAPVPEVVVPKPLPALVATQPVASTMPLLAPPPEPQSSIGKLHRLTRDGTSNAWVTLSSPDQPTVLFAQANVGSVPQFPITPLTTHSQEQLDTPAGVLMATQAATLGTVSGWVPAGVSVRVPGASRVDYYAEDGERAVSDAVAPRYFVARNVDPGAALVSASKREGGTSWTAAGVPVIPGASTVVDFRAPIVTRIRGHLWSSEAARARGVAHAEVKVVGFPDHVAISAADGSFDLGALRVARGIPVFVEARFSGGYTHRFAVNADERSRPVDLFLFSDARVQGWLQGLEGGVSGKSGLIVASVPAAQVAGGRPVVKPLGNPAGFQAETYWLTPSDELQDPVTPPEKTGGWVRWVGVELTSRGVLAGIQSARGRWIRTEWVPTSPGVISVLNPAE